MRNFIVKKMNDDKYSYVIFSTSYISPMEEIYYLEEELKDKYSGKVLFDLLLSNGNAFNRFVEAFFDGNQFDFKTFNIVKNVENNIKKESINFYSENIDYLNGSVLNNAEKFLIKKGEI